MCAELAVDTLPPFGEGFEHHFFNGLRVGARHFEQFVDFFGQVETTIFQSQNIGIGGTAQVKCYELPNGATPLQIAIKYLITPNSKTVSVVEEHDMLREV